MDGVVEWLSLNLDRIHTFFDEMRRNSRFGKQFKNYHDLLRMMYIWVANKPPPPLSTKGHGIIRTQQEALVCMQKYQDWLKEE